MDGQRHDRSRSAFASASLEVERLRLRYQTINNLGGALISIGFKFGTLAFGLWMLRDIATALGGKATMASVLLGLGISGTVSMTLSWTLSIGFLVWGIRERRLRISTAQHVTERITTLEKQMDSGRSTSSLPPNGRSRPEDV